MNYDTRFFTDYQACLYFTKLQFFNQPVSDQIEKIESYCLNYVNLSSVHTHNDLSCKSSNLVYFKSYSRHYIYFRNTVHDDMITIPVLYCKNDGHFHAVLPNSVFIPHSSFSLFLFLKSFPQNFLLLLLLRKYAIFFRYPFPHSTGGFSNTTVILEFLLP